MTLGQRLRRPREESGRTQEELSRLLIASGASANRITISRWECDEQVPTLAPIMELAKIYNVSADFIINGDCSNGGQPERDRIFSGCKKLNTRGVDALLKYLDYLLSQSEYRRETA